ncbi:unnamed protein product [Darwinula stevensoni]|uniref:Uncharacterized protein n=1 Tax=Darwinula stevensoni TaxID=69355 RepID=A0A7R8XID4_9CRUS|nr:unnamed protein product [Darwinula stevensoni]CAG0893748.1 unnamed protein product [Darwinula stevensoni]
MTILETIETYKALTDAALGSDFFGIVVGIGPTLVDYEHLIAAFAASPIVCLEIPVFNKSPFSSSARGASAVQVQQRLGNCTFEGVLRVPISEIDQLSHVAAAFQHATFLSFYALPKLCAPRKGYDQFGYRDKFLFSAKDGRIFVMVSDSIGDKTGNRLRMKGGDHKEYPAIKTAKQHCEPRNIEVSNPWSDTTWWLAADPPNPKTSTPPLQPQDLDSHHYRRQNLSISPNCIYHFFPSCMLFL